MKRFTAQVHYLTKEEFADMDHDEAVRHSFTEKYLLNELSPELRDQFEEHFFGCEECALDLRAASTFVERSKGLLTESADKAAVRVPIPAPQPAGWFAWLRPALAVPALALLLIVVGYQNLVTYPQLKLALSRPQVLPWAPINTRVRGSITPIITAPRGGSFLLLVNIPPDPRYFRYIADLYNPAGNLEWSLAIPAKLAEDAFPVQVPGANRDGGTYSLALRGITAAGQSTEIGRTSFELQIEK